MSISNHDELRSRIEQLEAETTRLRSALQRAEAIRFETTEGVRDYRADFDDRLATLRSQRAWKIMVWLRKAYTLLFREGRWAFLRLLLATPFTGGGSMEQHEPGFPAAGAYLPHDLAGHFTAEPMAPEELERARAACRVESLPPAAGYDVVILPVFHFTYRFQRPQQLARHFARAGHRVFWICPEFRLRPGSSAPYRLAEREKNLFEVNVRAPRFEFHRYAMERETAAAIRDSLASLYREAGIRTSCALVQFPSWRPVALALRELAGARVIYDCMDDWDTFSDVGQANIGEERRLVDECDLLVVTAQALAGKFAAHRRSTAVIRNGVDFDFFQNPAPAALPDLPRPVIGYYGAIAEWTDLELLAALARRRPQYSFVLLGQNHGQSLSRLKVRQNVTIPGQRPYEEMPAWLRFFDVCLIPFRLNQITHATDPVKLYEYFSLGKPVVATPMKELDGFGDLLYRGKDRDDFLRALDVAVREDDAALRARRIEFAAANTWEARVRGLDEQIRRLLGGR